MFKSALVVTVFSCFWILSIPDCIAWTPPSSQYSPKKHPIESCSNENVETTMSRRQALVGGTAALLSTATAAMFRPPLAVAAEAAAGTQTTISDCAPEAQKQCHLSDKELATAILKDIEEKQFMVTADITRSLYQEGATFQDEIDTYVSSIIFNEKSHNKSWQCRLCCCIRALISSFHNIHRKWTRGSEVLKNFLFQKSPIVVMSPTRSKLQRKISNTNSKRNFNFEFPFALLSF
jgi:hypothetical protein